MHRPALLRLGRQAAAASQHQHQASRLDRVLPNISNTCSPALHLPPVPLQIIAKCETRQSLFNFRPLVDAADAIIISRGNLGLDVVPEKMAMVQKAMVSTCAILGKTSIITRVVDTMIRTPRPTR